MTSDDYFFYIFGTFSEGLSLEAYFKSKRIKQFTVVCQIFELHFKSKQANKRNWDWNRAKVLALNHISFLPIECQWWSTIWVAIISPYFYPFFFFFLFN